MISGFTFAVACSVPEYVYSKPISTHSGRKGGEKRREGRLMILSSQGMGPFINDVGNYFGFLTPPTPYRQFFSSTIRRQF